MIDIAVVQPEKAAHGSKIMPEPEKNYTEVDPSPAVSRGRVWQTSVPTPSKPQHGSPSVSNLLPRILFLRSDENDGVTALRLYRISKWDGKSSCRAEL